MGRSRERKKELIMKELHTDTQHTHTLSLSLSIT